MVIFFSPVSLSRKNKRINQPNLFSSIEPPPCRHSGQSQSDESKTSTFDEVKEKQRRNQIKEYIQVKENYRDNAGDTYKKQQSREIMESKDHAKQMNFNEIRDCFKGDQIKDNYREKADYR